MKTDKEYKELSDTENRVNENGDLNLSLDLSDFNGSVKGRIINISFAKPHTECPKCKSKIPFEEMDSKYMKQDKLNFRMKCKSCSKLIGVTTDYRGDFVGYEL